MRQVKTKAINSSTHLSPKRYTDSKQHMKRRATPCVIKEMQLKARGSNCRSSRMTRSTSTPPSAGEGGKGPGCPLTAGGWECQREHTEHSTARLRIQTSTKTLLFNNFPVLQFKLGSVECFQFSKNLFLGKQEF